MQHWQPYSAVYPGEGHTTVGDLRVWRGAGARGIAARDVIVYLPPSYAADPDKRYPVLYLHDGQNVFDAATSFAGEWGADETAEALARQGLEAILVAIPNGGKARNEEYSPWSTRPFPLPSRRTRVDAYLNFVAGTVKPAIDAAFRSRPERAATGIAGSSLGGLVSLYASFVRPDLFGFCAALSPALWPGRGAISSIVQERPAPGLRVYLDAGRHEAGARFVEQVRRMRNLLCSKGYDVAYVEDADGAHNEESWRRRFPAVLAWFIDSNLRPGEPSPSSD